MVRCPRCDVRMNHALGAIGSEKFWFECPECGRHRGVEKFNADVYLGEPWTPMGFGDV